MKRIPINGIVAALATGIILQVQTTAAADSGFYRPLTLALAQAEAEATGGGGEAGENSTEALAKAAQNPIANMISVPFQNNFNFGVGPYDVMQYNLNIQPVIPISLSKDWNLITRTIMPIISQPSAGPGIPSAAGLGDINPAFYFSPAKPSKFIWGVGPTFTFPTATDPLLGNGKWCAGPALVGLTIQGHWVLGAVLNNQWSFAGWGDKDVNAFVVQPFINYNLPHGWYLTTSPIITADWKADSDNRWTLPLGGGVGKIFKLGKQPINAQLAAYGNVVRPDNGANWQLRFQLQFLFPK